MFLLIKAIKTCVDRRPRDLIEFEADTDALSHYFRIGCGNSIHIPAEPLKKFPSPTVRMYQLEKDRMDFQLFYEKLSNNFYFGFHWTTITGNLHEDLHSFLR